VKVTYQFSGCIFEDWAWFDNLFLLLNTGFLGWRLWVRLFWLSNLGRLRNLLNRFIWLCLCFLLPRVFDYFWFDLGFEFLLSGFRLYWSAVCRLSFLLLITLGLDFETGDASKLSYRLRWQLFSYWFSTLLLCVLFFLPFIVVAFGIFADNIWLTGGSFLSLRLFILA
jgi:hypothetical protein